MRKKTKFRVVYGTGEFELWMGRHHMGTYARFSHLMKDAKMFSKFRASSKKISTNAAQ